MTTQIDELKKRIVEFQYNPAGIQRTVLGMLSEITEGDIEIVDPTNPVVFTLESAAVMTAAFMDKNEANTRKQYPMAAQTAEDLYLHMSDRDYIDRFASPAMTKFALLLSKEEVLSKMIEDPITGIKKLVVPRNTFFTVADTVFSLQYPIEIRQLQHGGLQVVYDVDKVSPLQGLESNVIDWEIRKSQEGDWIYFEFAVYQFNIISQNGSINAATDFKLDIPFNDQYYYCRVFVEDSQKNWVEMTTTHTEQIYDPTVPTAVLRVVDKTLTVRIPQIYTSTRMLNSNVRIDVYETKGKLDMILGNYPLGSFQATWKALDKADENEYTAPLKNFRQIIAFSDKVVTGGKNAMTFEQLRKQVIDNAIGAQKTPITNVQLESVLNNKGYEVVKNIDVITNRVFLATKNMPTPANPKLLTAAASSIETVAMSIAQIASLDSVIDNGSSVTITPDTLYRTKDGITKLVSTPEVRALLAMSPDSRALAVTSGGFLYTPFHYVLDMTDNEFEVRPYYLDAPQVETKLFVSENDTTLLQVGTASYTVVRTDTGYQLQIVTTSGDAFKALPDSEVFVQLAYIPQDERDRAYLMGQLMGTTEEGERVYQFDLSSTFNVDKDNGLELTKFFLYTEEDRITKTPLLGEFDILYSTTAVMGPQWTSGSVDKVLGRFLLDPQIVGITHEKLRIRFGYALETLWSRSRSVIDTIEYKKHEVDVPRRYEKDIYLTDPDTGSAFTVVNGEIQYTILHKKGDLVKDADGNQIYQYRVGDVMLGADKQPIILNPRGMLRQIDVMLIEGAYWFATDSTSGGYRTELTNTLVDWLTNDLASLKAQLLEQTRLYFYPKTTLGTIKVMIKDGLMTSVNAGQAFRVTLYVNKTVYGNDELREQLQTSTIRIINQMLDQVTVSISEIEKALREQYRDDVIDVQLTGLGGDANLPALTVTDEGDRCSIRKRLVAQADDTLIVQEDVTIDFVRHDMNV